MIFDGLFVAYVVLGIAFWPKIVGTLLDDLTYGDRDFFDYGMSMMLGALCAAVWPIIVGGYWIRVGFYRLSKRHNFSSNTFGDWLFRPVKDRM